MTKSIKALLLSVLLGASVSFASSDLLSIATDGAVTAKSAEAVLLNDKEMKEVVGGRYAYYMGQWRDPSSPYSKIQYYGSLTDRLGGNSVWIAGERYGQTQSAGYTVYLTYQNPNTVTSLAWDSHGWGLNTPAIQPTAASSQILYANLNTHMYYMYKYRF